MRKTMKSFQEDDSCLKKECIAKNKQKSLKNSSLSLVCIYIIYLSKSALGINLSDQYSLPNFFKIPLTAMDCMMPIKGNYCHSVKHKIL